MSKQSGLGKTRVLLSFSSAFADLAGRLGDDLKTANIEVCYDPWEGDGDVSASPDFDNVITNVAFVLPLLTPSNASRTWIGHEWKQAVYDKALAHNIEVLAVRGEGDVSAIPKFLRDRRFADIYKRGYFAELRRLIQAIRDRSGDTRIILPADRLEAHSARTSISLAEHPLVVELGEKLQPLFESDTGLNPFEEEMIPMMRDGLFYELGVPFPAPHLRFSPDVPQSNARIVTNGIPECEVEILVDCVMVNDSVPAMTNRGFTAEPVINPVTNAKCAWIAADKSAAAEEHGLTTWDTYGFLIFALSAVLRRKAAAFIGLEESRLLLEKIQPVFPHLVAESVPKTVSLFLFTDVLRRLVAEEISIRDLRRILLVLAQWGRLENDSLMLAEYARAALKRQITYKFSRGTNQLIVFLLHPDLENTIREHTRHTSTGSYVDMEPKQLSQILNAIQTPLKALCDDVQVPQILTVMEVRSSVRRLVAPLMPKLHVVSYQELMPNVNIQHAGVISLDGFKARPGVSVGGVSVWS